MQAAYGSALGLMFKHRTVGDSLGNVCMTVTSIPAKMDNRLKELHPCKASFEILKLPAICERGADLHHCCVLTKVGYDIES